MCGICGLIAPGREGGPDAFAGRLARMTAKMPHRGPDDYDNTVVGQTDDLLVGFGQHRLSSLDLSAAGHQPMATPDSRYWITFNGEIYNFAEIRAELQAKGARFVSQTDTEVILHAYATWGAACLHRFNGMFALAIWDRETRTLFAARDRMGIKPFYYHFDGRRLSFASEIKALLANDWIPREVDRDALFSILLFLWTPDPKSMFKGILKLPAGHHMTFRPGVDPAPVIERYWDSSVPAANEVKDPGEPALIEELRRLLRASVERRMIADVPLGAFLSGGLDSSLIVALMTELTGGPIQCYTIAYRGEDQKLEKMGDDPLFARQVAEKLGAAYHEIRIEPDIVKLLPQTLYHLDEPIADPAAINTYLISKMAKENGTTVLLSGQGADEIFAGYRKHLATSLAATYQRMLPGFVRGGMIEPLVRSLPVVIGGRGVKPVRWAKRFLKSGSLPPREAFMQSYAYYTRQEMAELLKPEMAFDYLRSYPIRQHNEAFDRVADAEFVTQMCYVDSKLFLPSLNLTYSDKMTMAASVEGRVPFVDHTVVEFAMNLPAKYKLDGTTGKALLRKAARGLVPDDVIDRPKAPFGAPLRAWTQRDLKPMIDDLLSRESVERRGYFNYGFIQRTLERNASGKDDFAHRIWALLTLEIWHRIFIDGETPEPFPPIPGRHLQPAGISTL